MIDDYDLDLSKAIRINSILFNTSNNPKLLISDPQETLIFYKCTFVDTVFNILSYLQGIEVASIYFLECNFIRSEIGLHPHIHMCTYTQFIRCQFQDFFFIRSQDSRQLMCSQRDRYKYSIGLDQCVFHIFDGNIQNYVVRMTNTKIEPTTYEWIKEHGEEHPQGFVFYKYMGLYFPAPRHWVIKKGSVLTESLDPDPREDCSYGISMTSKKFLGPMMAKKKVFDPSSTWKVLLRYEDIGEAVHPYFAKKIRAGRVTLMENNICI